MTRDQRDGLLFVLLAAVAYACMPILLKAIYADPVLQPLDVLTWRFIFAAPLMWLTLRLLRAPRPSQPLPRLTLLVLGVMFAGVAAFAFFALDRISASLYTVLLYTYPAMVAVLSLLIGERLPLRGWLALALTLVGVVLTVPELTGAEAVDGLGVALALGNAALYAVYLVVSGRVLRGHAAAAYAGGWTIIGALLVMVVIAPLRGLSVPTLPGTWLGLVVLAFGCTVVPLFALLAGIGRLGASRAAILSTTEPAMTVLLAMVLLREGMSLTQLLGGLLILASVVLLQLRGNTRIAQ